MKNMLFKNGCAMLMAGLFSFANLQSIATTILVRNNTCDDLYVALEYLDPTDCSSESGVSGTVSGSGGTVCFNYTGTGTLWSATASQAGSSTCSVAETSQDFTSLSSTCGGSAITGSWDPACCGGTTSNFTISITSSTLVEIN